MFLNQNGAETPNESHGWWRHLHRGVIQIHGPHREGGRLAVLRRSERIRAQPAVPGMCDTGIGSIAEVPDPEERRGTPTVRDPPRVLEEMRGDPRTSVHPVPKTTGMVAGIRGGKGIRPQELPGNDISRGDLFVPFPELPTGPRIHRADAQMVGGAAEHFGHTLRNGDIAGRKWQSIPDTGESRKSVNEIVAVTARIRHRLLLCVLRRLLGPGSGPLLTKLDSRRRATVHCHRKISQQNDDRTAFSLFAQDSAQGIANPTTTPPAGS